MYKIQINVLVYKHKQYNYIGVTKLRDYYFLIIIFFKNLQRITNIEPKCICINKIV